MDMATARAVEKAVCVLATNRHARVATVYLTPKLTVRAAHVRVKGRVPRRGPLSIVLTVGRPNARAAAFIKKALRAGEPFPIKRAQLTLAAK